MTANTVHAAQNLVFNPFLFMKLFNLLSQTCMTGNYIFLIEAAMCHDCHVIWHTLTILISTPP